MHGMQNMNHENSSNRGSLRSSQPNVRTFLSKENACGPKYRAALQQLARNLRPPSLERGRTFGRNITNIYFPPQRKAVDDNNKKRGLRPRPVPPVRESRSVSYSFTFRNARVQPADVLDLTGTANATAVGSPKEAAERKRDPQLCEEYAGEIEVYLKTIEGVHLPKPDYMAWQKEINTTMRAILVDWIVDVHIRFKLLPETLFLTVNLIDRYLEKEQVDKQNLQLVGVTATLVASKYEEIYPPEVKDFVYITDNAYTSEDILRTEQKMLQILEFNLNIPSSNRFLQRYTKQMGCEKRTGQLAQYLLELSLVEAGMLKYPPSVAAAAALYLANKLCEGQETRMARLAGYGDKALNTCAKDMVTMLQTVPKSSLQAVRRKFSSAKYMEVAQIEICRKQ